MAIGGRLDTTISTLQIYLAVCDKYILQFKTNTLAVDPWPLAEDWTQQSQLCKYILKFEKNIFCNLKQIYLAI